MSLYWERFIQVSTEGRYLVCAPDDETPRPLIIGFHGYGENAEEHLKQLRRIPGSDRCIVAAVQGIHWFYRTRTDEIVASWMTRMNRERAIQHNLGYVRKVVAEIEDEFATSGHIAFVGFSQGAAMAYRAALHSTVRPVATIVLGGDVPPDVASHLSSKPSPLGRVLIGHGAADDWYTDEKLQRDIETLRKNGIDPDVVKFDGGHEWSEPFIERCGLVLDEIFAVA